MDENIYKVPLTQEYEVRGCTVKLNAAVNVDNVDITVKNNKTGQTENMIYRIQSQRDSGYSDVDMRDIKECINSMLDRCGDPEWKDVTFTNTILS